MLNIQAELDRTRNVGEKSTEELLQNLGKFPSSVLPIGVLRELQSRGDAIHDSLVELLFKAIETRNDGLGSLTNSVFFSFAILVPIAKNEDRKLIATLLLLPPGDLDHLIGDLAFEAMSRLIAKFFHDHDSMDVIAWTDHLADQLNPNNLEGCALFSAMTLAVGHGDLDRLVAIDALIRRMQERADEKYDLQSACIVTELIKLAASDVDGVDAVVRSSFEREQIDTDFVEIESWNEIDPTNKPVIDTRKWIDPVSELSTWSYRYLSDDIDPMVATFRVNELSNRSSRAKEPLNPVWIDQLRQSSDKHFPRDAVEAIDLHFANAYPSVIDLIREEIARYQLDSNSWSGNGAYLGLVLSIVHQMPLPREVLETILQMPQADRDQLFGDQFGLIVQSLALTPFAQYDFVEQWIWNPEHNDPDRREMIGFYVQACRYGMLDRTSTINTLVDGLRRALDEEPVLIADYAENLALMTPKEHSAWLEGVFKQEDVDWWTDAKDLRRLVNDAKFARTTFHEHYGDYRSVVQVISSGVMFDPSALNEKPRVIVPSASKLESPPGVHSKTTIRNEVRTPRNADCPCGSGKKFKKCCLHKRDL